ncbi:hypothetical protein VTN77DRAFT_35 [Rasamsonia byssochlamydoides]|uniref:uncharacterized protein n=1 Tax=Rasamsonia byssochlamydoides TaxID=89139 RepID=UPI0037424F63
MMLLTPTTNGPEWGRSRRQTDPNLVRRPSDLLRQAARRSVDYSLPPADEQRPQTSAARESSTQRSSLSVHALSNPALAEIPSRKFNALRQSTSDSDSNSNSSPSTPTAAAGVKHGGGNVNGNVQSAPCTPDLASRSDAAATTSLSNSPKQRSPSQKRPPASHSSLGVETSTGPPPALSTQHSAFQDRILRQSTPISPKTKSPRVDAILKQRDLSEQRYRPSTLLAPHGAAARLRKMSATETYADGNAVNGVHDPDRTITPDDHNGDEARDSSPDESRSKNEDVFLNIAKSTASRRDSMLERRRRLGLSGLSTRSSLATEQNQSSPLLPYPSPASAHPFDENSRLRYFGSSSRSTVGLPRSRFNRETSPESPRTYSDLRSSISDARPYRHSNLSSSTRTVRPAAASDASERARSEADKARLDGTESTSSATAPSTVWDELDDLKSRIRKLELTGKFPPSSAAAMSNAASAERPRTATTTVTTVSSSPKHNRKTSTSPDPEATATVNPIQTLLHSALAKAKAAVSAEVYNALEATTTDALTLANMLSSSSPASGAVSVVNGSSLSERQARRKADSLCRSLTELCLALSDEHLARQQQQQQQQQQRPVSRDARTNQTNGTDGANGLAPAVTFRRSMGNEPESSSQQESAPRIPSRLEARRASAITLGTVRSGTRLSPDEKSSPQTAPHSAPISRFSRLSALRTKREDESDDKGSVFSRTVGASRAMSEVGGFTGGLSPGLRSSTRERLSREYASSTESPSQPTQSSQQTRTLQSSIPLRRSYASPGGSGIPATSGVNIQPGFRRYGLTHSVSDRAVNESGGEGAEASQTRIVAPSSKTASSYTPIQTRARTNSLGSRRFGLRPRPSTVGPVEGEN